MDRTSVTWQSSVACYVPLEDHPLALSKLLSVLRVQEVKC